MTLKTKILAGAFALAIGSSVAIPTTARADWWHHSDHQAWSERHHDYDRYRDHDRDYARYPDHDYGYYPRQRPLPANGEGMINKRHPNLDWACDADGHHCHWARR